MQGGWWITTSREFRWLIHVRTCVCVSNDSTLKRFLQFPTIEIQEIVWTWL